MQIERLNTPSVCKMFLVFQRLLRPPKFDKNGPPQLDENQRLVIPVYFRVSLKTVYVIISCFSKYCDVVSVFLLSQQYVKKQKIKAIPIICFQIFTYIILG